jgi:hypothetical protein
MLEQTINHHIQKFILHYLISHEFARFRDLRPPKVDTNLFSYHLKLLQKSGYVEKTDDHHPVGERNITLSNYRYLLTGFDFGQNTRFNSLLRVPLSCSIDRNKQQASVQIPAFACSFGLNTTRFSTYAQFRIRAALGIVTDMALNPANQNYEPVHDTLGQGFQTRNTEWFSTQGTVEQQELQLSLLTAENASPGSTLTNADTLLLTVIVEFGAPDALGNIMPVRGAGGGMVLGVK